MAGSRQVAVDHLHQALYGACNRLALLRWCSLLSDEAVNTLATDGPGLQMLRSTITALEADDFDAAWIAARSLEKPPQSLQAELDVQQAWRAAVASADDPEVALVELDRATQALEMVSDPVFRKALSKSLGELSRWRWLAATSLVERQREEHVVQALSQFRRRGRVNGGLKRQRRCKGVWLAFPGCLISGTKLNSWVFNA